MPKFIVTANKLNRRRIVPASLPDPNNIIDFVPKNFIFDAVEASDQEMPPTVHDKWYKDNEGRFYWGGGINEIRDIKALPSLPPVTAAPSAIQAGLQFDPAKMSWGHKFYDIPFIWNDLNTMGKGVTVAVIDTGVDEDHLDLISNIHPQSKSFIGDAKDIKDIHGHGTRMAGIIAGSGNSKIFGVAPAAKILIVRATSKRFDADINIFTEAIKFATSLPEVDIVSISYSFPDDPAFKQAVQNCLNAKKIVLASIGNVRDSDIPEDDDTFPACYNTAGKNTGGKEVLAVGGFDKQKRISGFSNWNKHLCFLGPGEGIFTANIGNGTIMEDGTSIATAFNAGCLALMISFCKLNNKAFNCSEIILDTCDDFGPQIGHDNKSGFGFMNLRNAVSKIK